MYKLVLGNIAKLTSSYKHMNLVSFQLFKSFIFSVRLYIYLNILIVQRGFIVVFLYMNLMYFDQIHSL
jgi:hypothetical protein